MILYHATTRANLESILAHGLLISHADAQARLKAVWLHTASKSIWAILHTQTRHRAPLEEVVVITVLIPRAWRRRFKTGLWWTPMDIPPDRLGRIIPGIAYAESAT